MVRWMCDVKLQDRVPGKELRGRLGLDDIISVVVPVFCSYEQVLDINAQTPGRQERRSDGALTDILSWDIAEVVSPCLPRGLLSHDRSFPSRYYSKTDCKGMGMCCKKKIIIG